MARVEKPTRDGRVRWYARYRAPDGSQKSKTFSRRIDPERYLTGIESTKLTGTYIDPARARLTIGTWAVSWLDGQAHLKPSTAERYAGILREHVLPRWADVPLADVSHAEVQDPSLVADRRWTSDHLITSPAGA